MATTTKIAVVLTALDRMSNVVNNATANAQRKLKDLSQKKFIEGAGLIGTGAAIFASLQKPIQAYADLEEANTRLSATMMDNMGRVDANFKKVVEVATQLGNALPGATKDFNQLFQSLISNGVNTKSILDGVGKAAAYLAIDLKQPMEVAGEFAARMKTATGVADNELLKFFDSISRMSSMGIKADEMQYAFSRSAGTLKLLGLQGLEASNKIGTLYSMLIRTGQSGETVGTSFNNIIQSILDPKKFEKTNAAAKQFGVTLQFFKDGKFEGVDNMIGQFDKLKGLDPTKMAKVVNALTGGGQDAQALNMIIQNGLQGYKKMEAEIGGKASLAQKIQSQLGTLSALKESASGTIENMQAAFGKGLEPALKIITDHIIKIADATQKWLTENPRMAEFLSMTVALSGAFLALGGVVKIIQGITVAMKLLNLTMKGNPFILFASIAIAAGAAIYANWDKIRPFFSKLWNGIKKVFNAVWDWIKDVFLNYTPLGQVIKNWDAIKSYFSKLWDGVKNVFNGVWDWFKGVGSQMLEAGKNIVNSIWEGIKAMANKPVDAIKDIVNKIRNHLPFSPAKVGPLRDIHRIRLVETIAEGIKPNKMMQKMKSVAKLALTPFVAFKPIVATKGIFTTAFSEKKLNQKHFTKPALRMFHTHKSVSKNSDNLMLQTILKRLNETIKLTVKSLSKLANIPLILQKNLIAMQTAYSAQKSVKSNVQQFSLSIPKTTIFENITKSIKSAMQDIAKAALIPLVNQKNTISDNILKSIKLTIKSAMQDVAKAALIPLINPKPILAMQRPYARQNSLQSPNEWYRETKNQITNNITIHLTGSANKDDARLIGREIERRFEKLMKNYQSQKLRVSF